MAAEKKTQITQSGLEEIQKKYQECNALRDVIAARLDEARKQGDLSENSEYDEAKEAQTNNEREIKRLKAILDNYEIITVDDKKKDIVQAGKKVTIRDDELGEEETYQLVGTTEADPENGKISIESPVGKSIIGHKKGEQVWVETKAGKFSYTIVGID